MCDCVKTCCSNTEAVDTVEVTPIICIHCDEPCVECICIDFELTVEGA